jgi:hypothetical protein
VAVQQRLPKKVVAEMLLLEAVKVRQGQLIRAVVLAVLVVGRVL